MKNDIDPPVYICHLKISPSLPHIDLQTPFTVYTTAALFGSPGQCSASFAPVPLKNCADTTTSILFCAQKYNFRYTSSSVTCLCP